MRFHFRRLTQGCTLLALAAAAPTQSFWIVDVHNRPGTNFTDLPPAVAAAAPGDVIVVRYQWIYTGCCSPPLFYTAPTIDKPLLILGEAITASQGYRIIPDISGMLNVHGIGAGSRVVLANLRIDDYPATSGGINCQGNAGEILLANCEIGSRWLSFTTIAHVQFVDCQRVLLRDSTFHAHLGRNLLVRSDVTAENCAFGAGGYSSGRPGLELQGARAVLVGCTVNGSGGFSYSGFNCTAVGYQASVALTVDATSSAFLGPATVLNAPRDFDGGFCSNSVQLYDAAWSAGHLEIDPAATLTGPVSGSWLQQSQWQTRSSLAPIGGTLTSGIDAWPNMPVILAASMRPAAPLPTPLGELWLEPASMLVLRVGVADASGHFAHSLPVGTFIPIGQLLAFQAVGMQRNGSLVLASPSATPILPPLQ